MTDTQSHEIFTKAIAHFGPVHQIRKCIEELTELSLALQRYLAESSDSFIEGVVDELADVYVTTEQMAILFGGQKLLDRIDFKLKRLEDTVSETFFVQKITDDQLEHTVTADWLNSDTWIRQLEGAVVIKDEPKKPKLPFFDGIGDEYDKVLITQGSLSGSIFSVEPIIIDGKTFINAIELGHTIDESSFYPVVPTWIILKSVEEDKTLMVTVWSDVHKKFFDCPRIKFDPFDSPNIIHGLRKINSTYNDGEKVRNIMKILGLKQDAAEALVQKIGWARIDKILSLSDRPE